MKALVEVDHRRAPFEFARLVVRVRPGVEWKRGGDRDISEHVGLQLAPVDRQVVYGDRVLPFSSYDSIDPEDLWRYMASYEQATGGRILALAHNGNLSNGLMFDDITQSERSLDRDYAERRMRWEPIYEVTQIKGDGETHPLLSPDDEFADYGTWDKAPCARSRESGR